MMNIFETMENGVYMKRSRKLCVVGYGFFLYLYVIVIKNKVKIGEQVLMIFFS